jgi:TolA-binding protein
MKVGIFLALLISLVSFPYVAHSEQQQETKIKELESAILSLEKKLLELEKKTESPMHQDQQNDENFDDAYSPYRKRNFHDKNTSHQEQNDGVLDLTQHFDEDQSSTPIANDESEIKVEADIKGFYEKAVHEIRNQKYDEAFDLLSSILESNLSKSNNPEIRDIVAHVHYLIGQIYYKKHDYQKSSDNFLTSYNIFESLSKGDIRAANSLFGLFNALNGMEKNEGACNTLKKINKEFKGKLGGLQSKLEVESIKIKCQLD